MATASVEQASKALRCQTLVLKVSIHCQGCTRKVKKVLQGIDGVYSTAIDPQQQRVTVTGIVGVETLIKKLNYKGKYAEIWPQNESKPEKERGRAKNRKQKKDARTNQNWGDLPSRSTTVGNEEEPTEETKNDGKSAEISSSGSEFLAAKKEGNESKYGCLRKTKKSQEGHEGNDSSSSASLPSATVGTGNQPHGWGIDHPAAIHLNTTHQYSTPYLLYIPQMSASSHSSAFPIGSPAFDHVLASPHMHARVHAPMDSFNIFSDENVNGCCII
ncbi:hypothetical protein K2173_007842 [Erythroxylum novogranatense]|uniref:HMA domain-containing protein n=1 Tax=Erythroxylum novogranatense TaxID=1862640 RepID=A0AAV8TKF3_9ROSI|nr:hypothetical protein K2173_007842 [Erythroxylum novogranatense]